MKFRTTKKTRLLFFIGMVATLNCINTIAAIKPSELNESDFFEDTSGSIPDNRRVTLTNDVEDDSSVLNDLIRSLSNRGGGVITIPAGTWILGEIELRSNIHLMFDTAAVVKPKLSNKRNKTIFKIGHSGVRYQDMSIRGIDGQFTIDMSEIPYQTRVTPFNVKEVENFMVSGCFVKDKFSIHAALNCSVSKRDNVWRGPKKGLVKDITVENGHGGYGGIQVRTGADLLFKHIKCLNGGVALRIETDDVTANASTTPPVPQRVARISNINGYDIFCKNGNAAVMMQPWGASNGEVHVQKVKAESSMCAVRIDKAYEGRRGSFNSNSTISEVTCIYGTNAQVKEGVKTWVPCALRNDPEIFRPDRIPYMDTYHKGPTIAPILYRASYVSGRRGVGLFDVNIPTENELRTNSSNFPSGALMISRGNNKATGCHRLRSATISSGNLNQLVGDEVSVYPNPIVGDNINVSVILENEGELTLEVYDFTGKVLAKKSLGQFELGNKDYSVAKHELNMSNKGIYLIRVKCDNKVVDKQKVIVQ